MTTIAVPRTLAEALGKAKLPVRLVDEEGNLLGSFSPARSSSEELTPEELSEIKRRMKSPGPRYSTEQVLSYIDSLEKK